MKTTKRLLALVLALISVVFVFVLPASAAEVERNVKITSNGQVVDSLNGVDARYIPGLYNSNTGTYCCAQYVKNYYKKVFGVTVSNLLSNCTPVVSERGYTFKQITSGITVGDVVRLPGHWAIVKAVSGNKITLIEQNWKWNNSGATYCKVNRVVTLGSASGLVVFRLYKNGTSVNGTGSSPSSGAASANNAGRSNASAAEVQELLFHATFYANIYDDLRNAFGYNASSLKNHWKNHGISEGRVASPFFDAKWYMAHNPDVAAAYGATNWTGAYTHFIHHGFNEGRQGSPYFSAVEYLNRYSDLKNAFGNNYLAAARHYLNNGLAEGRQASSQFSIAVYSQHNPDVTRAFSDPLYRISHYIAYVQYGTESRKCV